MEEDIKRTNHCNIIDAAASIKTMWSGNHTFAIGTIFFISVGNFICISNPEKWSEFLLRFFVCIANAVAVETTTAAMVVTVAIVHQQWNVCARNNSPSGIRIKIYDENADLTDMFYRKTAKTCSHKFRGTFGFPRCRVLWGQWRHQRYLKLQLQKHFFVLNLAKEKHTPQLRSLRWRERTEKKAKCEHKNCVYIKMKHATGCNAVKTSKNYDGNNKISHLL